MNKLKQMKNFLKGHWREILLLVCGLVILYQMLVINYSQQQRASKEQEVIHMTQDNLENINALQNKLKINKQNAEVLKIKAQEAQVGQSKPKVTYIEKPVAGKTIVEVVQNKVAKEDVTLPPSALEKTDKTVVVEQPENPEVPVGIYKINTYRNWEVGMGVGSQSGNPYIPISIQRNYDKCHSVMLEAHYDVNQQTVNGAEVQWKVHF